MRKALCLITGMAALAFAANAQVPVMHLAFSTDAAIAPTTNPEVLVGEQPATLYLWADVDGELYNSLGVGLETTGSLSATGTLYDATFFGGALRRWTPFNEGAGTGSDFAMDSAGDNSLAFRVTEQGLGSTFDADLMVDGWIPVGEVELSGGAAGDELRLTYNEIARSGGSKGDTVIQFGFGDDGITNADENKGAGSAVADATITPEPASLVLLALAGLALRRR